MKKFIPCHNPFILCGHGGGIPRGGYLRPRRYAASPTTGGNPRNAPRSASFVIGCLVLAVSIGLNFFAPSTALALEGDWQADVLSGAWMMPEREIYGGGAEFAVRYHVLDGLSAGAGVGAYGVRNAQRDRSHGVYVARIGMLYALDILQWVPSAGVHFSALFSEDNAYSWHRDGHGLGIDFDIHLQYRGVLHWGFGIFASYHLVFTDLDYITVGVSVSWFSGEF